MLKIRNTLTKGLDEFIPIEDKQVNIFVCGPTVYDYPHLGHAKTYTQFDFIVRYLRFRGYEVFYLQNITDIDDKIIERANKTGLPWKDVARKYEAIYKEDMQALRNLSVNEYARATDHIDTIIEQIKVLMDKGYAYSTPEGIYYQIDKFEEYGKLSGRTEIQENDALTRIDEGSFKRGWNDFCLWKKPKENDPFWEADFGRGRPGWHIEDTAITEHYFGPQYDIHGGAIDLIFPHHECEIAQMEAASGKKPLVKYWVHTGFLNINAEKMSKSTGNFKTVRDMLQQYDFRVIRFFILSAHYKATIDFSVDALVQAQNTLRRIANFTFSIDESIDDQENEQIVTQVRARIITALDNDFNTPNAFAELFTFIREQNKRGNANGIRVMGLFKDLNQVFGDIFEIDKQQTSSIKDEELHALIQKREQLRREKNYKAADEIREQLLEKGYELLDSNEGVKWKKV